MLFSCCRKPFFSVRASLPRFIYVNFYNILTKITIEKISANLSPLELGVARCQLDTNPCSKVFIIPQHRPRQSNLTCEARERKNSNNVQLKQSNSVPLVSCRRVAVCGSDVPVARCLSLPLVLTMFVLTTNAADPLINIVNHPV